MQTNDMVCGVAYGTRLTNNPGPNFLTLLNPDHFIYFSLAINKQTLEDLFESVGALQIDQNWAQFAGNSQLNQSTITNCLL